MNSKWMLLIVANFMIVSGLLSCRMTDTSALKNRPPVSPTPTPTPMQPPPNSNGKVFTIDQLQDYIAANQITSVDQLIEKLPASFKGLPQAADKLSDSDITFVRKTGALCRDDVDAIKTPRVILTAADLQAPPPGQIGGPDKIIASTLWLTFTTKSDANAVCANVIELIETGRTPTAEVMKFAKGTFNAQGGLNMVESAYLTEVKNDSFNMFAANENCGTCHTESRKKRPALVWDGGVPGITLFYWTKGENWRRFYGIRTRYNDVLQKHDDQRTQMLTASAQNLRLQKLAAAFNKPLDQLVPKGVKNNVYQGAPEHFLMLDTSATGISIPFNAKERVECKKLRAAPTDIYQKGTVTDVRFTHDFGAPVMAVQLDSGGGSTQEFYPMECRPL